MTKLCTLAAVSNVHFVYLSVIILRDAWIHGCAVSIASARQHDVVITFILTGTVFLNNRIEINHERTVRKNLE